MSLLPQLEEEAGYWLEKVIQWRTIPHDRFRSVNKYTDREFAKVYGLVTSFDKLQEFLARLQQEFYKCNLVDITLPLLNIKNLIARLLRINAVVCNSDMCRMLVACAVHFAAIATTTDSKYKDMTLNWSMSLLEPLFIRKFPGNREREKHDQTKPITTVLEASPHMMQMMAELNKNQLECSNAIIDECAATIVKHLDNLEISKDNHFGWLPPEQQLLIPCPEGVLNSFCLEQISIMAIPIMKNKSCFEIVHRIASWPCHVLGGKLSQEFIQKLMQNKSILYDKFPLSTKISLLERHMDILVDELLAVVKYCTVDHVCLKDEEFVEKLSWLCEAWIQSVGIFVDSHKVLKVMLVDTYSGTLAEFVYRLNKLFVSMFEKLQTDVPLSLHTYYPPHLKNLVDLLHRTPFDQHTRYAHILRAIDDACNGDRLLATLDTWYVLIQYMDWFYDALDILASQKASQQELYCVCKFIAWFVLPFDGEEARQRLHQWVLRVTNSLLDNISGDCSLESEYPQVAAFLLLSFVKYSQKNALPLLTKLVDVIKASNVVVSLRGISYMFDHLALNGVEIAASVTPHYIQLLQLLKSRMPVNGMREIFGEWIDKVRMHLSPSVLRDAEKLQL